VRIALDMEKKYLSERAWKEFRQKIRRGEVLESKIFIKRRRYCGSTLVWKQ